MNCDTFIIRYRDLGLLKTYDTGFILLDTFMDGEEIIYVGQSLESGEVQYYYNKHILQVISVIKSIEERSLRVFTNWYEVVGGQGRFHHQAPFKDIQVLSPTIIDNRYGLQSDWVQKFWEKENVYYINNKYVGRARVC